MTTFITIQPKNFGFKNPVGQLPFKLSKTTIPLKNRNELWFLNIISPGIFFTCIQEPGVVYPVWYGWVPNQSGTAGPCHVQDGTPGCPQVVELAREIFHENYRYQYLLLVAVFLLMIF